MIDRTRSKIWLGRPWLGRRRKNKESTDEEEERRRWWKRDEVIIERKREREGSQLRALEWAFFINSSNLWW